LSCFVATPVVVGGIIWTKDDCLPMSKSVNIEVYCDIEDGEKVVFGVASEHRPDLPKPFDEQLQNWVQDTFGYLEIGDELSEAGEMVYIPNDDIIRFETK